MEKFDGTSALIVGGGRGLGKVTSLVFAEAGVDVVVTLQTS